MRASAQGDAYASHDVLHLTLRQQLDLRRKSAGVMETVSVCATGGNLALGFTTLLLF